MATYTCPMHDEIREPEAGQCPKCHMALVPEDARHPFLQHIVQNPMMLIVLGLVMLAVMAWLLHF